MNSAPFFHTFPKKNRCGRFPISAMAACLSLLRSKLIALTIVCCGVARIFVPAAIWNVECQKNLAKEVRDSKLIATFASCESIENVSTYIKTIKN